MIGLVAATMITVATDIALLSLLSHGIVVLAATTANYATTDLESRGGVDFRKIVRGAAILVTALIGYRLVVGVIPDAGESPETIAFGFCWPGLTVVFVNLVSAPVVEEVLFRRLLFDLARERRSSIVAVCLSSLAFGAWHFQNGVFGMLEASIGGALLAFLRLWGGGIGLPVTFHAITNAMATIICEQ